MCQVTGCLLSTIEHMIDHQHDKYLSESEADKKEPLVIAKVSGLIFIIAIVLSM